MEKERYELQEISEDGFFYWYLKDNDTKLLKPIVDLHNCVKLLNQQDARIKELEEQNKNLEYARQLSYKSLLGVEDDYQDLKQENKQLKQQLEEKDKTIEMLKSIDRYDIGEMLTENVKLKAELHTQPKEIVEKIKEYINTNAYYYEEECFAEHVNSYLDEILKEYGEE